LKLVKVEGHGADEIVDSLKGNFSPLDGGQDPQDSQDTLHRSREDQRHQESRIENPESRIETKRKEGKQAQDKHSWLLFHFGLLLSALRPKIDSGQIFIYSP